MASHNYDGLSNHSEEFYIQNRTSYQRHTCILLDEEQSFTKMIILVRFIMCKPKVCFVTILYETNFKSHTIAWLEDITESFKGVDLSQGGRP